MNMHWPYKPDEPETVESKVKVEGGLTPAQLSEWCREAIDKARPVHRHTPLDHAEPSEGKIVMLSGATRKDN